MTIKNNIEFWEMLDKLVCQSKIIIDRPKGSVHPKYNKLIYPVDYGYLEDTSSMDNSGIDIFQGTGKNNQIDAIICAVDILKRDSEIKILLSCTEYEKELIYNIYTQSEYMKGIMIERN